MKTNNEIDGGKGTYRITDPQSSSGYFDIFLTDLEEDQIYNQVTPGVKKIDDNDITNKSDDYFYNQQQNQQQNQDRLLREDRLRKELDMLKNKERWREYDMKRLFTKYICPELFQYSRILGDDYVNKFINFSEFSDIDPGKLIELIDSIEKVKKIKEYDHSSKYIQELNKRINELENKLNEYEKKKTKKSKKKDTIELTDNEFYGIKRKKKKTASKAKSPKKKK